MHKPFNAWLDMFLLLIMLAVSAVITLTSVSLIVGDTANIVQDKVLIETGRPTYEEMEYTVQDVLLTVVRLDTVYPIDTLNVKYDVDPTIEGENGEKSISIDTHSTDTALNKEGLCRLIMQLREQAITAQQFYDYPVHFKRVIKKDSNKFICQVIITKPGVLYNE